MADIKDVVKEKYGKAALRVTEGAGTSCCGPTNDALRRAAFPTGHGAPAVPWLSEAPPPINTARTCTIAPSGLGKPGPSSYARSRWTAGWSDALSGGATL